MKLLELLRGKHRGKRRSTCGRIGCRGEREQLGKRQQRDDQDGAGNEHLDEREAAFGSKALTAHALPYATYLPARRSLSGRSTASSACSNCVDGTAGTGPV